MDFTEMTNEELYELIEAAQTELGRRQTRDVFEDKIAAVVQEGRDAGVVATPEPGEQWKQPSGAHDAYAKGDIVEHNGQQWVSTVTPNVWIPGQSGWRHAPDIDPDTGEPGTPEWVRPSGAHDAYALGDRVVFEGQEYESVHEGANTWSPSEYPPAWQLITDDEDEDDPVDGEPAELPEWDGNAHNYTIGDTFTYEGTPYRVRQDHTSQPH